MVSAISIRFVVLGVVTGSLVMCSMCMATIYGRLDVGRVVGTWHLGHGQWYQ